MTHERWDDYLVAEHEMIERAMAVFKAELETIVVGSVATYRLRRAVDFLLQFGDRVHNVKEETVLFPLMGQRGIPSQGGPIGVMLAEHEAERTLLQRFLDALPGLASLSDDEAAVLKSDGAQYLKVRAEHIWKENDVLYPMGRKVLTDEDNGNLVAEFEQIDKGFYGDGAGKHFTQMIEEAEEGARKKPLIESLSYEQLQGIMEALPFEVTFVDADDTVAYFNRLDREKIFVRTRSVIGRKVFKCHPSSSVDRVEQIVEGFKKGTLDKAEFWIDFRDEKVMIRYFPVRSDAGTYLGVLEVTQAIGAIQAITGQKRLLEGR